jgi:hypothetical protein
MMDRSRGTAIERKAYRSVNRREEEEMEKE